MKSECLPNKKDGFYTKRDQFLPMLARMIIVPLTHWAGFKALKILVGIENHSFEI